MDRPLVVSEDPDLIDELVRLAAANGVEVHVATDAEAARSRWSLAPLILVGVDLAARVAGMRPERRRDVVLVGRQLVDADWQRAVTIGAEHVACLPDAERWLIDRLADSGEGPPSNGLVVSVMSTGGGAGASTFAATLAAVAAEERRVLLVDLDPSAGGLDVLVGREGSPATRWEELASTRGRLSPTALRRALPEWAGVSVLSWGRSASGRVEAEPLTSVLDAGERGFDLVVLDVARWLDPATELALARSHRTVLVTSATVRGVSAAAGLTEVLGDRCASLGLVTRRHPGGVSPESVVESIELPALGDLPHVPALARRCESGEGPALRGSYARAVRRILPQFGDTNRRVR